MVECATVCVKSEVIQYMVVKTSTGTPRLTRFPNNMGFYTTRLILVLSFVHLVLNHSSTYTVFCSHGCFFKVSKKSVNRGPPVLGCHKINYSINFLWFRKTRGNITNLNYKFIRKSSSKSNIHWQKVHLIVQCTPAGLGYWIQMCPILVVFSY